MVTLRLVTLLMSILPVATSLCYFPDGNSTNDAACGGDGTDSTCCGPGYACLSNNLCALTEYVDKEIAKQSPSFVRGGCTDKSWSSENCPNFCVNATNGDNLGLNGMGVGKCDGEGQGNRYYCRNQETAKLSDTAICGNKKYYFEFDDIATIVTIIGETPTGTPISTAPSASSTTSSASSLAPALSTLTSSATSTTPPPSESPSPSSNSTEEDRINKQRAIGLGVGLGLGIPLLIAFGVVSFLYLRKNRSSTAELDGSQDGAASRMNDWNAQGYKQANSYPIELVAENIQEAPGYPRTFELSKDGKHI